MKARSVFVIEEGDHMDAIAWYGKHPLDPKPDLMWYSTHDSVDRIEFHIHGPFDKIRGILQASLNVIDIAEKEYKEKLERAEAARNATTDDTEFDEQASKI